MKRNNDGTAFLKVIAAIGTAASSIFVLLQLIPFPGLSGVHFCKESYIMLIVWIVLGGAFGIKQRKYFDKI